MEEKIRGRYYCSVDTMSKTDAEWKKKLTPEQYHVMREGGTEAPFSGKHVHEKASGRYKCAACGNELFRSDTKFDSGTGWPSFDKPLAEGRVTFHEDGGYGAKRTEVRCGKCGAHMGHVFDDGPTPTGKRYCINSVCLDLEKQESAK